MARSKRNPGPGHNSEPLTDDEKVALQVHHSLKIRATLAVAAQAKATYDAARTEVNSNFKRASGDMKWTRKEWEDLLEKQDMSDAEFRHSETKRAERYKIGSLPVGVQIDMFAHQADTVDDKTEARENGRRAGLRAADPVPPDNIATFLHTDWLEGWNDGQEFNGMQLAKAGEILAARQAASVGLEEGEDPDEEDEDEDTEEVVAKRARALKKSGWTDPTPEEAAIA